MSLPKINKFDGSGDSAKHSNSDRLGRHSGTPPIVRVPKIVWLCLSAEQHLLLMNQELALQDLGVIHFITGFFENLKTAGQLTIA